MKRWPHVIICLFDCSNSNYLECPGGRYGHNCQRDCSKHCMIKGNCKKVTGDCENGCQTGWKNSKCDLGNVNSYLNFFFILYSNSLFATYTGKNVKNETICIISECDGGTFGEQCENSCGKCLNNEQCHHINGSCLNGCSPGYQGINCTEGTDIIS